MAQFDPAVILERLRALEAEVASLRRQVEASRSRLADTGYLQVWAFVQLTGSLTTGSFANARFWKENDDGTLTLSAATDVLKVYSPKYHKSLTFASGKEGLVLRWFKRWWWIGGECPT